MVAGAMGRMNVPHHFEDTVLKASLTRPAGQRRSSCPCVHRRLLWKCLNAMSLSWSSLLIGRPVANREAEGRKLGVLTGVPAMGLDGLGSASYGPEAALTILAATGASGLDAIGPITWVILVLLAILFFSYWQTIAAYPNNGGSYVVA